MQNVNNVRPTTPNAPGVENIIPSDLDTRIQSAAQERKRAAEELSQPAKLARLSDLSSENGGELDTILEAVYKEDWNKIEKAIQGKRIANVNEVATSGPHAGMTILAILTLHKQWKLVRLIIDTYLPDEVHVNAKPIGTPFEGITILHALVLAGQKELVRTIVMTYPPEFIDIYSEFKYGQHKDKTVMHLIARGNQWDVISHILYTYPRDRIDINAGPHHPEAGKVTLLKMAAHARKWDIVKKILKDFPEVEVDLRVHVNKNILSLAAQDHQWAIFRTLYRKSVIADLDQLPQHIITSIVSAAIRDGQLDVVNAFSEWKEEQRAPNSTVSRREVLSTAKAVQPPSRMEATSSPLISLALNGEWTTIRERLQNRDVQDLDLRVLEGEFKGANLIWLAAFHNKWPIVQKMLQHYALFDINAVPENSSFANRPVIWLAAKMGKWQVVRSVRKYQPVANLKIWPPGELNVTLLAASKDQHDIVEKIIDELRHNAIDFPCIEQTICGVNIAWFLAMKGDMARVQSIIERFPHVNCNVQPADGPDRGKTLAWILASRQEWGLVEILFKANSRIDFSSKPMEGSNRNESLLSLVVKNRPALLQSLAPQIKTDDSYFEFMGECYSGPENDGLNFAEVLGSPRFPELPARDPLPEDVMRSIAEFTFPRRERLLRDPSTVDTFIQKRLRDRMVLIASSATRDQGASEEERRALFRAIFSELKLSSVHTDYPRDVRDRIVKNLRTPGLEIADAIRSALLSRKREGVHRFFEEVEPLEENDDRLLVVGFPSQPNHKERKK